MARTSGTGVRQRQYTLCARKNVALLIYTRKEQNRISTRLLRCFSPPCTTLCLFAKSKSVWEAWGGCPQKRQKQRERGAVRQTFYGVGEDQPRPNTYTSPCMNGYWHKEIAGLHRARKGTEWQTGPRPGRAARTWVPLFCGETRFFHEKKIRGK